MLTTNKGTWQNVIADVEALSVWEMANSIDVRVSRLHDDTGALSDGADMLDTVRRCVVDQLTYAGDIDTDKLRDDAHEIADGAVPVYTYRIFSAVVDLCAFDEDIEGVSGDTAQSFERMAQLSLYVIANNLVHAFADFIDEAVENYEG